MPVPTSRSRRAILLLRVSILFQSRDDLWEARALTGVRCSVIVGDVAGEKVGSVVGIAVIGAVVREVVGVAAIGVRATSTNKGVGAMLGRGVAPPIGAGVVRELLFSTDFFVTLYVTHVKIVSDVILYCLRLNMQEQNRNTINHRVSR